MQVPEQSGLKDLPGLLREAVSKKIPVKEFYRVFRPAIGDEAEAKQIAEIPNEGTIGIVEDRIGMQFDADIREYLSGVLDLHRQVMTSPPMQAKAEAGGNGAARAQPQPKPQPAAPKVPTLDEDLDGEITF